MFFLNVFHTNNGKVDNYLFNFVGENGRIEYELVAEDNKEKDFDIDRRNGTIFSSRLLDRETRSFYNLLVLAKDKAKFPQPRLSASVQVIFSFSTVSYVSLYCM